MSNRVLIANPEKCTGCMICQLTCALKNEKVLSFVHSRIAIVRRELEGMYYPIFCLQCEIPACEMVCPTKALVRNEETGAIEVEEEQCIGCRLCVQACPFGGISYHSGRGKSFKCELCGGDPECVKVCEVEAIRFERSDTLPDQKRSSLVKRLAEAGSL